MLRIGGAEDLGPILMDSKPVHVLQRGATVEEIVNVAAIAVVDAQETEAGRKPTSETVGQVEGSTLSLEAVR